MTVPERVLARLGIQGRSDVPIAKTLGDMVARQHGREQVGFFFPSRVEARVTPPVVTLWFRQFLQIVITRCWIIDRRQGFQIALVAGQGMALIVV